MFQGKSLRSAAIRNTDFYEQGGSVRICRSAFVVFAIFLLGAGPSHSQVTANSSGGTDPGYFANWFKRVDKTQAEQPHSVTPLATTPPRREEEYRFDLFWQTTHSAITTDHDCRAKRLELT